MLSALKFIQSNWILYLAPQKICYRPSTNLCPNLPQQPKWECAQSPALPSSVIGCFSNLEINNNARQVKNNLQQNVEAQLQERQDGDEQVQQCGKRDIKNCSCVCVILFFTLILPYFF